jgi:hypothetical protein
MNLAKSKLYAYIHMSFDERTKAYPENAMPSNGSVKVAKMCNRKYEEYTLKNEE